LDPKIQIKFELCDVIEMSLQLRVIHIMHVNAHLHTHLNVCHRPPPLTSVTARQRPVPVQIDVTCNYSVKCYSVSSFTSSKSRMTNYWTKL